MKEPRAAVAPRSIDVDKSPIGDLYCHHAVTFDLQGVTAMKSRRRNETLNGSAALAVSALLCGCSSMPATTIESAEAFHRHALRVDLDSAMAAEEVARCFESSAGLLPGATITPYPQSGDFVYRLRAGRFLFELIELQAQADGTSRVVIEVTPDYNAGMRDDFVTGRLVPLYRCAGAAVSPAWPAPATAG